MAELQNVLGQTIVNFSRDGVFPEEDAVSAMYVQGSALSVALQAVSSAKAELETEVRNISSESAPEVDSWMKHAKALQEDIDRSRRLANELIRQAKAGDTVNQAVKDGEDRVEFLSKEARYDAQLGESLRGIKKARDLLDEAEHAAIDRKILPALHILSNAWDVMHTIPANERTRAIRLLDERAFVLRASIHESFSSLWQALVNFDVDSGTLTIQNEIGVNALEINAAIIAMKAYKELDSRIKEFCSSLESAIIRPRFDLKVGTLSSIDIQGNMIRTSTAHVDRTIKSLLLDLEQIIMFIHKHLPADFTRPLSQMMMPKLCSQIKETWLDSAVPASLEEMTAFRKAIALVQVFADNLKSLQWIGYEELHEWVANAPRIWLTKRRESSLDWTRNQLSLGIGLPRKVDRVETQTISHDEGRHINAKNNGNGSDWDAEWSDDNQELGSSVENAYSAAQHASQPSQHMELKESGCDGGVAGNEEDDATDAWGWGDNDSLGTDAAEEEHGISVKDVGASIGEKVHEAVTEITLTEQYTISSMPEHILKTIISIIEDGTALTQEANEQNPVTTAAAGLFALPTLVLAMYRAVSYSYYSLSSGGNMYLYNDAMWLAEQLRDFTAKWSMREDLNPRARGKVQLESEIKILEKYGKRAYSNEMNTQRTILKDLLGGAQNFLQQEGQSPNDNENTIDGVVSHIRLVSAGWKEILSKSAWAQATGSLLSTVAKKIILDVEDLTSLGADEAYRVANLISRIVKLDDLFLPDNKNVPQIPMTSQYAPNWLKLHFLCEALQSDLKDVKYLWFESDLSLYFTAEEVVDLVELSFENNPRTREAIASIRDNPRPRVVAL